MNLPVGVVNHLAALNSNSTDVILNRRHIVVYSSFMPGYAETSKCQANPPLCGLIERRHTNARTRCQSNRVAWIDRRGRLARDGSVQGYHCILHRVPRILAAQTETRRDCRIQAVARNRGRFIRSYIGSESVNLLNFRQNGRFSANRQFA